MNYIVAGIMLVLASLVGAVSCAVIPYYESKKNNETEKADLKLSAAGVLEACRRERNYIFLSLAVLLCVLSAFVTAKDDIVIIDIVKQNIASLFLLSAMLIDRKTHLIPNVLNGALMIFGAVILVFEFIFYRETFKSILFECIIGFMVAFVVFYILARLTKEGIGMGDVKLIAAMGWVFGLEQTLVSVLLALVICAITAVLLIIAKKKTKNDSIPFGPFLFFGYTLLAFLMAF